MEKILDQFLGDIKNTFLEKILNTQFLETERMVCPTDSVVGEATDFEKKCFSLFLLSKYPEKHGSTLDPSARNSKINIYENAPLMLLQFLIADRLNIENSKINKIWIRNGGKIVLDNDVSI